MKKPREQRASSRGDAVIIVTGISLVGMLIFRLVLGKIIGDKGLACFGLANELYFVVAGAVSYGLSEAVASLVRYRVRRGQYKSAQKIFGTAVLVGCVLGAVLGIGALFAAHMIAIGLFHVPLAGLAIAMAAPAFFFFILTGAFRGYFQGNGARIPVMHSQILQVVFLFAGGMIGVVPFCDYGAKVSALLQNVDYTSSYGAMGACIGLLCSSVMCFLHMAIMYFLFRHNIEAQIRREPPKNQDGMFHALHMVLGTSGIYILYWLFSNGWILADAMALFGASEDPAELAGQWGAYYGKVMAPISIVACLASMVCLLPIRRIVVLWERGEDRLARDKLGLLIHQCAVITIPAAVFLAVLSENLLNALYGGDNHQSAGWMQAGCVLIVFLVFSSVFMEILLKSRKLLYVAGITVSAFVLQLGVLLLVLRTDLGILGVVISSIVFFVLIAGCGFWIIMRIFRYRQEWIRTFAVTAIAAAVSGVLAMLLNKGVEPLAGALVSMLVSLLAAVAVYLVLLTVLRAFRADEMGEVAGGFLLRKLTELLHMR